MILANDGAGRLAVEGAEMHDWNANNIAVYNKALVAGVSILDSRLHLLRWRYEELEKRGIYVRPNQGTKVIIRPKRKRALKRIHPPKTSLVLRVRLLRLMNLNTIREKLKVGNLIRKHLKHTRTILMACSPGPIINSLSLNVFLTSSSKPVIAKVAQTAYIT